MIADFVAVIILIAVWWYGLFAVLSGIGLLGRRAFGLLVQGAETWVLSFWSGWIFAILILQLWHLCLKIDVWAFAFIVTLGTVGLLWNRRDLWQVIRACLLRNSLLPIIILFMSLWIANRAIGPIQNGDTGLYHMTAVKWNASYPIVPGLGNLHGRLAFNNSFFLYVAMLGVGPWVQKSHYLANGLLTLVLLAQLLLSLQKIISGYSRYRSYHLFNSLFLAPTFAQVLNPSFSSLTPDIAVFVLGTVLASQIYSYFIDHPKNDIEESYKIFFISVLCIGGIIVKLSFLPFGITALLIVLAKYLSQSSNQAKKLRTRVLLWITLFNGALLTIWMLRGVILSGYVAFPFTLGSLPVTWRVPRPLALSEANWIRSFARAGAVFWTEVLTNWNWLRPWLKYYCTYEYIKPLIIGLLGIIFYLMTMPKVIQNSPRRNHISLVILVPPFTSVIFWFFLAPDPRFSGASFWIFGAGFTALALDTINLKNPKIIRFLQCFLSVSFFVYLFPPYNSLFVLPNKNDGPFYNFPNPEYTTVSINNLTSLNIPLRTDQCWNIPLPCTPYYRPTLHLRKSSLDSGFMLDNSFTFADMHQGSVPKGFIVSPRIGVALTEAIWYDVVDGENIFWMRTPGKILVYTEHAIYVKLSLKPIIMNVYGSLRNEGQLKIALNSLANSELPIKSGTITEAVLALRPDFNIIALDLRSADITPNEINVGNVDARSLSVAFHSVELTSVVLLK
jgi:hypothetical protein